VTALPTRQRPTTRRVTTATRFVLARLMVSVSLVVLMAIAWEGAAAAATAGAVIGTVTVTGAPSHTKGYSGIVACPISSPAGRICPHPHVAQVKLGVPYGLSLRAGHWRLTPFYSLLPYGGARTGTPTTIHIRAAHTSAANFRVSYTAPGTVRGPIGVDDVPNGVTVTRFTVVACRPKADYRGGTPPFGCAGEFSGAVGGSGVLSGSGTSSASSSALSGSGSGSGTSSARSGASATPASEQSSTYAITTLPPGEWILYPEYSTVFGSPTSASGTLVTVSSGATTRAQLTEPYIAPTHGAVAGTATLDDAPPGLSGVVGVAACAQDSSSPLSCPSVTFSSSTGQYQLALRPGTWWVSAFYVDFAGDGSATSGTPTRVAIQAGSITSLDVSVTYRS
jgi:hypothetical protein